MKKILVTGASGCVGANLVKKLAEDKNNEISIFIPKKTWHPYLDNLRIKIFYGDIRNKKDVLKAMKNCDYVYQVAGIVSYNKLDDDKVYSINVNGVKTVLECAKELNAKKVVVTASTAGIGIPEDQNKPLNEDSPFNFNKYKKVMYMYSKYLCIQLCKEFSRKGVNVSIVSPTTIFGQGDTAMNIGNIVKKISEKKLKFAPPGGNSVISVNDTVDAHILVMEKGKSGENYIFANEFIPFIDLFNKIAVLIGGSQIKKILPMWVLPPVNFFCTLLEKTMGLFNKKPLLSSSAINFSFKYRYFNSDKARSELNWKPKENFENSMIKAINFYKKYNLI